MKEEFLAFSIFHTRRPVKFGTKVTAYLIAFMSIACLYFLPYLFPNFIGTSYIAVSLFMAGLSVWVWRYQVLTPRSALMLSILLCLFLAPIPLYTSNDVQRYLWDGAVFMSGFDPYIIAPNDPVVSQLREVWPTPEEHGQYATLYPPGGLTLFYICALAGPIYGIWVWKTMVTLAVISSLILTYDLLKRRRHLNNFHLLCFSPLLLFEAQVGGHLDVFSLLGITAALWCLEKDKVITAGVIIGLAATIKFLPAVLVGPFLFYLKPRDSLKLFISSAAAWLSVYGLMFSFGYKPLGVLPVFFEKWRGGAPIYPYLEMLKATLNLSQNQFLYTIFGLAALGFGISAWTARKGRIEIAVVLALSIPLLFSPVLFPWYLMSLLPLLALKPNLTLFTALTLAPLSYVVLNRWLSEGVWEQESWPANVLLFGLIAAFSYDIIKNPDHINHAISPH